MEKVVAPPPPVFCLQIINEFRNKFAQEKYPQRVCQVSEADYDCVYNVCERVTFHHKPSKTFYVYVEGEQKITDEGDRLMGGRFTFVLRYTRTGKRCLYLAEKDLTGDRKRGEPLYLSQFISELEKIYKQYGDLQVATCKTDDRFGKIIAIPDEPKTGEVGPLTAGRVYSDGETQRVCII